MATIEPFRALRPLPAQAATVCELPYDVMSSEEAREMADGNPNSFLRVSKPEICFPPGQDATAPEVYVRGREEFDRLQREGLLCKDEKPGLYVYRLTMGSHVQTGLVAVASCTEYREGIVRKHEFTRPDKENDRVRHIEVVDAQTGPVFLTYRASSVVDGIVAGVVAAAPEVSFVASDGVKHEGWSIFDEAMITALKQEFAGMNLLYIADGHHRSAAASRVDEARGGRGDSGRFLAVIFPDNQMQVLPYNRVVADLNGLSQEEFLAKLAELGSWGEEGRAVPSGLHEVCVYLGGVWRALRLKPELYEGQAAVDALDAALLQRHVLDPLLGIDNPRTSNRIQFIGGIRGTAELEKLVKAGKGEVAFSLHPTSVGELMAVADADGIMPPKSTWFEPKLRDGMFTHQLESVE
jgi:uncharacterized protein (DUF1015 family)